MAVTMVHTPLFGSQLLDVITPLFGLERTYLFDLLLEILT